MAGRRRVAAPRARHLLLKRKAPVFTDIATP